MIKANELRLHNITEDGIVSSIFRSHFCVTDKNGIVRNSAQYNIRPIPLTPEILEQCGFEKNSESRTLEICYEIYTISYDGQSIMISDKDFVRGSGIIIDCKFVHQLQNITYALTGEELEVRL